METGVETVANNMETVKLFEKKNRMYSVSFSFIRDLRFPHVFATVSTLVSTLVVQFPHFLQFLKAVYLSTLLRKS